IARLAGRAIQLVRVVEEPPVAVHSATPVDDVHHRLAAQVSAAEAALTALSERVGASTESPATWTVLRTRDVAHGLITHAVGVDALLIVLGTRAAGAGTRAIVGSVADR